LAAILSAEYGIGVRHRCIADGPRWTYRCSTMNGDCEPDPDPRALPDLPLRYATPGRAAKLPDAPSRILV
jgi:hypothetical protein